MKTRKVTWLFLGVALPFGLVENSSEAWTNTGVNRNLHLHHRAKRHNDKFHHVIVFNSNYGRNAEIWPTVSDDQVHIRMSFPNSTVPTTPKTMSILKSDESVMSKKKRNGWKSLFRTKLTDHRLRRDRRVQDVSSYEYTDPSISKIPLILALALARYMKPFDYLVLIAVSGYLIVLQKIAAQQRSTTNLAPNLPALPPQGHVPYMLLHPLGYAMTNSSLYRRWLKLGIIVGVLDPLLLMVGAIVLKQHPVSSLAVRPLFFLSCQAVTESLITRRVTTTPLPIRILVPILYNTIRLGYVYQWALSKTMPLGNAVERWLAIANLAYTLTNLFAFLLPVACIRYMRAHFFGVEAEQVVTRHDLEDSIGFL